MSMVSETRKAKFENEVEKSACAIKDYLESGGKASGALYDCLVNDFASAVINYEINVPLCRKQSTRLIRSLSSYDECTKIQVADDACIRVIRNLDKILPLEPHQKLAYIVRACSSVIMDYTRKHYRYIDNVSVIMDDENGDAPQKQYADESVSIDIEFEKKEDLINVFTVLDRHFSPFTTACFLMKLAEIKPSEAAENMYYLSESEMLDRLLSSLSPDLSYINRSLLKKTFSSASENSLFSEVLEYGSSVSTLAKKISKTVNSQCPKIAKRYSEMYEQQ